MKDPRPLQQGELGQTFASRFAPIADRIRQIPTNFGIRPYRVFLVRTQWSGERRGQGSERVVSRDEILPTPKVIDTTTVRREVGNGGVQEVGGLRLERVTTSLSEDRLTGREEGQPPPPNVQLYFEIVEDGSVTKAARRRRYAPRGVPHLKRGGVHWVVPLERQYQELDRDGKPLAAVRGTDA